MEHEEALRRVDRIVRTVREGKVPYRVLQVVLYGSVAKGAERPADVDVYVQLDNYSVPGEDLYREMTGRYVTRQLRRALLKDPRERVDIQWGPEPWDKKRLDFVEPDEVERAHAVRVSQLDLSLKTHRQAKARLDKSLTKVRSRPPFEWPPTGEILYEGEGPRDPWTTRDIEAETVIASRPHVGVCHACLADGRGSKESLWGAWVVDVPTDGPPCTASGLCSHTHDRCAVHLRPFDAEVSAWLAYLDVHRSPRKQSC